MKPIFTTYLKFELFDESPNPLFLKRSHGPYWPINKLADQLVELRISYKANLFLEFPVKDGINEWPSILGTLDNEGIGTAHFDSENDAVIVIINSKKSIAELFISGNSDVPSLDIYNKTISGKLNTEMEQLRKESKPAKTSF
jgi:hypothetical protein